MYCACAVSWSGDCGVRHGCDLSLCEVWFAGEGIRRLVGMGHDRYADPVLWFGVTSSREKRGARASTV